MSVPFPVLLCPTPESRRAALIAFSAYGINWCGNNSPLEADLSTLAKHEDAYAAKQYWKWGRGCAVYMCESLEDSDLTPVNSVPHFISYLRRHGLWSPPASHV